MNLKIQSRFNYFFIYYCSLFDIIKITTIKVGEKMKKYCILGEGNVGITLGAYLAGEGNVVKIYKEKKLKKEKKNWEVSIEGSLYKKGKISLITNDMSKAMKDADVVFITVPAFCRKNYLDNMISIIDKSINIVFFPDNYGVWELNNMIEGTEKEKLIKAVGTSSFVYPCRKFNENLTFVKGIKNEVFISSLDKESSKFMLPILNELWNIFEIKENYLEIQLLNMNPIIHPAVLLLNLGRIENQKGKFDFYSEGITKTIAGIIEKIDLERINVGRAWGIELKSLKDIMEITYLSKEPNLFRSLSKSSVHKDGLAPSNLNTRYIKEDIPYGLAPISNLGEIKGVKTPVIDTLIDLSNILLNEDYRKFVDVRGLIPYI